MEHSIKKNLMLFVLGLAFNMSMLQAECLQCNPSIKGYLKAFFYEIPKIYFDAIFRPTSLYEWEGSVINLKSLIIQLKPGSHQQVQYVCSLARPDDALYRLEKGEAQHNYYRRLKKHHPELFALIYGKEGILALYKQKKDITELQNKIIAELDILLSTFLKTEICVGERK